MTVRHNSKLKAVISDDISFYLSVMNKFLKLSLLGRKLLRERKINTIISTFKLRIKNPTDNIHHPPLAIGLLHPLPEKGDGVVNTVLVTKVTRPPEHLHSLDLVEVRVCCGVLESHGVVQRSNQGQHVILGVVVMVDMTLKNSAAVVVVVSTVSVGYWCSKLV